MDQTTAVMTLLGGMLLMASALRRIIQKRRVVKNSEMVRARVTGFAGRYTVYHFMRGDRSVTVRSLERTRQDGRRLNTLEQVRFNPQMPQAVVIANNSSIEINAVCMALVGILAIAGGLVFLLSGR